jgi:hypothetical protein
VAGTDVVLYGLGLKFELGFELVARVQVRAQLLGWGCVRARRVQV